mmetsp:Transcript_64179/g.184432  ORF Transcript_64179/g.184432 Transcript_64179/m.184432 type:complete len:81 (+) Transcript_64179:749-991(+)
MGAVLPAEDSGQDHRTVEKHAFPTAERTGQEHQGMKCGRVELNTVREKHHCLKNDIGQSSSLSCLSLLLVLQNIWEDLHT